MATNYGTCIAQYFVTPDMQMLTGVDCVADDLLCRITTPILWYDPDYGYDVQNLLNSSQDPTTFASSIVQRIEQEIKKDDRVSKVNITSSWDGSALTMQIDITLSGGEQFSLVGKPIEQLTTDELLFSLQK